MKNYGTATPTVILAGNNNVKKNRLLAGVFAAGFSALALALVCAAVLQSGIRRVTVLEDQAEVIWEGTAGSTMHDGPGCSGAVTMDIEVTKVTSLEAPSAPGEKGWSCWEEIVNGDKLYFREAWSCQDGNIHGHEGSACSAEDCSEDSCKPMWEDKDTNWGSSFKSSSCVDIDGLGSMQTAVSGDSEGFGTALGAALLCENVAVVS
eukprot:CAMPEP_0181288708 /NCGR_PEP_ID=MMETSP1101-20121128/484_1 /TAXON_ID=46948 /ORGANISM="Rhodomonas abbreviata, Strain Caron Lab Isolate" /LENGTH=205 /DNA_ID=CAMNT_0023392863 /DNA_START=82 /DNA_END=699 /DNA_ORIENTATION=-